jgi:hypothetical protein
MYCHYAMFTLRDGPDRATNALKLMAWLQRLGKEIDKIQSIHIDLNAFAAPAAADMLMMTTYASAADMAAVRADPRHQAMLAWYRQVAIDGDRREVNFVADDQHTAFALQRTGS